MRSNRELCVLRLGHRPGRDERMTTHVGLTARALGADRVVLPAAASGAAETIREVTGCFGGPFDVETTESPGAVLRNWTGSVAHLTMYGERVQDVEDEVRGRDEPLLLVVGGGKVPFSVYEHADWNVAVTNQPHSEVAALAVFLDRFFEGRELDREWEGAERRVYPEARGKRVESVDEDG